MTPFEVRDALNAAVLIVDTREQDTAAFHRRIGEIGLPVIREKLDFGDYSIRCPAVDLSTAVTVERKMSLDELCICFCKNRPRFTREFERCKAADAKMYLLVENGDWEKVFSGTYRSQMHPDALAASLTAWLARYNVQLLFCKAETAGRLIRETLYRELKERLEEMANESGG